MRSLLLVPLLLAALLALFSSTPARASFHDDWDDDSDSPASSADDAVRLTPEEYRSLRAAESTHLNASLLWGTYRPQNYFGFRPRLPQSVFLGLAWADVTGYDTVLGNNPETAERYGRTNGLRHQCDDRDGVLYKWTRHDGRAFGEQYVRDLKANVEFRTSFVKFLPDGTEEEVSSSGNSTQTDARGQEIVPGGSWAIRVSGKAIDPNRPALLSFFTYFGTESDETTLQLESEEDEDGIPWEAGVEMLGSGKGLGDFSIKVKHSPAPPSLAGEEHADLWNAPVTNGRGTSRSAAQRSRTQFGGARLPYAETWRVKDLLVQAFSAAAQRALSSADMPTPQQQARMTPDELKRVVNEKLVSPAFALQLPSTPISTANQAPGSLPNLLVFQDTFDLNPRISQAVKARTPLSTSDLGSFSFDIFYQTAGSAGPAAADTAEKLSTALLDRRQRFDADFAESFRLKAPFDSVPSSSDKSSSIDNEAYFLTSTPPSKGALGATSASGELDDRTFARELLSSAVGGVGYFYGTQLVDRSQVAGEDEEAGEGPIDLARKEAAKAAKGDQMREEGPYALTTGTPGRSVFPRGFYWDEGFHLAAISSMNNDLGLAILKSWFSLVDNDGWVGRELALGKEAASRVPEGFLAQIPLHGNPPTLTMAVAAYIDRLSAAGSDDPTGFDAGLGSTITSQNASASSSSSQFLTDRRIARAYLRELYPPCGGTTTGSARRSAASSRSGAQPLLAHRGLPLARPLQGRPRLCLRPRRLPARGDAAQRRAPPRPALLDGLLRADHAQDRRGRRRGGRCGALRAPLRRDRRQLGW